MKLGNRPLKPSPRYHVPALFLMIWVSAAGLFIGNAWGATTAKFEGFDGSGFVCLDPDSACKGSRFGLAGSPGPALSNDRPIDHFFLRLAPAAAGVNNTVAFSLTDPGLFGQVVIEFDFRITLRAGKGRADGFGVALLNTSLVGNNGAVFPPQPNSTPEEPNFKGSLGIGFDIFKSDTLGDINHNHLSIHFNEATLKQIDLSSAVDLAMGEWIHARITVSFGTDQGTVSVVLTPRNGEAKKVVDQFAVDGLKPYEGRLFFGARTGAESADHDLDNINAQFSGSLDPAIYGAWSPPIDSEVIPIHSVLLPTGKVMYWENGLTPQERSAGLIPNEIRLWDPFTGAITIPALPGYDIFCAGHSLLPDGRLLITGGHIDDLIGMDNSTIYDPFKNTWTDLPKMNAGRWYPTSKTLADGNLLVVSGEITPGVFNRLPQIWESAKGGWRDLSSAVRLLPLYPYIFQASNGMVFNAGPNPDTAYLDTNGRGLWTPVGNSKFGLRDEGSSVMYDDGKILIVGGGKDQLTNTAEVIDLNLQRPFWTDTGSMAYKRRYATATLLPDGKVLVTGGTASPGFNNPDAAVRAGEIWDPATGVWSMMAGMQFPRIYHSTALLLQDGRVLVGGGGRPAPFGLPERRDFEIYSPPYLFRGARPIITAAPAAVTYGETFQVETPGNEKITNVNWIRLPAVTHTFNQNQHINKLSFSRTAEGLNVTAPADSSLAPPGHYMLFILDDKGVPSVAKIIQIETGFSLSVSQKGPGRGRVIGNQGIDCGTVCSALYPHDTIVSLFALPESGSTFVRWDGDPDCSDGIVSMDAGRSCSAIFNLQTVASSPSAQILTVTRSGAGKGRVISLPGGIDCGSLCRGAYPPGTSVTLTAEAEAGSLFVGWKGNCSGTGPCEIAINQETAVTATFENDGPQSQSGKCFIATAAYGSYLDPHVQVLRSFRDRYLLTNSPGRRFVAFYYRYSPPVAALISKVESLRVITRMALTPIVYTIAYPSSSGFLLLIVLGSVGYRARVRRKKRPSGTKRSEGA